MKKKYIKPTMDIVEMETDTALLAGSSDLFDDEPHGRENACLHGHHKWFCDD